MLVLVNKKSKVTPAVLALLFFLSLTAKAVSADYYQLKIYHFTSPSQEDRLDRYFRYAFIPAMHKAGITNIGVFKPLEQDTDKRIYVFIPYKNWNQLGIIEKKLSNDKDYLLNGSDYINSQYDDYPYLRIEIIILEAFQNMPQPAIPKMDGKKSEFIYELRSYENPNEKAGASKIKMMNEGGEIKLFKSLNFNAVFYGKVIAGSRTPNIMYMTSFKNFDDRKLHWDNFAQNPGWKALVAQPEYQHNLNKADKWLLHSMAYSDF